MEKNENQFIDSQSPIQGEDEIMNRVNQTFDKITQDVRSMIENNNHESGHS